MKALIPRRSPSSSRLDRWLGSGVADELSRAMRGWYGPPIVVVLPGGGALLAHGDGDFSGVVRVGAFASLLDRIESALRRAARRQSTTMNAGFSSLSDLIMELTQNGKARPPILVNKQGSAGAVGASNTLWRRGAQPVAGTAASAAPGGRALTKSTQGALDFVNASGGDTLHMLMAYFISTVGASTLLCYDRLFDVAKTMNSTATEAVTGVPTRYQNTVAGSVDSAEGNFLFVDCVAALPATAHNWATCLYTDQGGTTGVTLPTSTGVSSLGVDRIDHANQWWMPLATGDTGIKALTQMQCSALLASGNVDFVIGHPLMWMPCPVANVLMPSDGVNDFFNNLPRIFDDACISFLEIGKPAGTATTYNGTVHLAAG